jgi:hypothetical protein
LKCTKDGLFPCDLAKANAVGPLALACRALAECIVDSTMEIMLGTNNPPTAPLTDKCAQRIGGEGAKFVLAQLMNSIPNRKGETKDDKTPGAEAKARASIAKKCLDPIGPPANLGGDCRGSSARSEALNCLFDQLHRATPLP